MTELLGLKAISKFMGVSVSTIRRWHKKYGLPLQKVPLKKVNGKLVIDKSRFN